MENHTLLNWRFWLSFYFFVSYSLCLLDMLEGSTTCSIKLFFDRIFNYGIKVPEDLKEGRGAFLKSSPIDFITQSFCITFFVGAVQIMLTSKGIQLFTLENIICCLVAALFSIEFHNRLIKALFDKSSTTYRIFIPTLISFSFVISYLLAAKLPELYSIYAYPGELIYKSFLIPWLPWLIIAIATSFQFSGAVIICVSIIVIWLIKLIEIVSIPIVITYRLFALLVRILVMSSRKLTIFIFGFILYLKA